MTTTAGPTVVRRQLGRRLRQLRDRAGVSVDEVVSNRRLGISRAKLFKLEAGRHSAKPQDIAVLCAYYRASGEETEVLQSLALATQESSWWHVYGDDAVPASFNLYIDLEPVLSSIRKYEAETVPGLLQTRAYATAIFRCGRPEVSEAEIQRRLAVRMKRQVIFDQVGHRHRFHAVLNEAVLLRAVGGPEVMAEQLARLRAAAARPEITLEVLPLAAGAHAGMYGAFALLDFPDPVEDPSLAYVETPISAAYLQRPEELERYENIFAKVRAHSVPLLEYSP